MFNKWEHMFRNVFLGMLLIGILVSACAPQETTVSDTVELATLNSTTDIPASAVPTDTLTPLPTFTFTPAPTDTATPLPTETATTVPAVESLKAVVTADLLSCRYGPGSEYLFLYGLRKGANIVLIGQSQQASSLVGLLQTSSLIVTPALTGSVQTDPRTGRERFTLTAKVAGMVKETPDATNP